MAATDETRLMLRLEANSTKMQAEVRKASMVVAEAMKRIDTQSKAANRSVYAGIEKSAKHLQDSAQNYRAAGFAAQNAAFQVGDFFTQVAGGTSATRAMAQQLPQLLGSFGLIGALAGAAAAALVPLAGNLFSTAEEAQTVGEAMKGVSQSMTDYQRYIQVASMSTAELTERFGVFAGEVRAFSIYMAGISLGETVDGLKGTVDTLKSGLAEVLRINEAANTARAALEKRQAALASGDGFQTSVDSARRQLESQQAAADKAAAALGMTVDQAVRLNDAILALGQSRTMEDMATNAAKAGAIFREIAPIGYELPEPLREAAGAIEELMARAAEANTEFSKTPDILSLVVSIADSAAASVAGIGTAAAGALGPLRALAQKAWEAGQGRLAAEGNLEAMKMEFSPAGRAMERYASRGTPTGTGEPKPTTTGGPGGGRGSSTMPEDFLQSRLDQAQRSAEAAQIEARAILMGAEAAATAKAKFDLLNEAKRQKLDLDKQNTTTGMTLRQEIDRQSEAIGRLAVETDRYRERAQFAEQNVQTLKEGFLDAIVEGENLSGTLEKLAKSLARAALEAALFGSGPFAGGGGGGGLVGGLFKGIFGGFRAEGGPVSAGRAYVVGEEGPELMVPRSSGTIIPNRGGGGGGMTLSFTIDARGAQIGVAEQIRAEMARTVPQLVRQSVQGVKAAQKRGIF